VPAALVSSGGIKLMRVGMGLIKNEHGVWLVRKKVPKRLGRGAKKQP